MNKNQTITLSIAALLLVANLLFPPWEYTFQNKGISQVRKPAGYALILAPPAPERDHSYFGVAMDTSRLVVQSILIVIAGGVGFYTVTVATQRRSG